MSEFPDEPAPEPVEPPVMPTADEARAMRPDVERPPEVRYAFVVWLLAGVFGIVNAVVMLFLKQRLIDTAIKANKNPNATNQQIASGTTTTLWMLMVAAVAFAVLFGLFAYKATQDAIRRARLLLTMLCALTVLFYGLAPTTPFGLLAGILALGATVLMYLPRSNRFFAPGDLPT